MLRLNKQDKFLLKSKIKGIKKTNDKIKLLILEKLKQDFKNKISLKASLQKEILNKNILVTLKEPFDVASDIWELAGDQSIDSNYYSKRILLSGIYLKLLIKIFNKQEFLEENVLSDIENEIKNIGKINQIKSKFQKFDFNCNSFFSKTKSQGRGY